jgi:hypothetical protein
MALFVNNGVIVNSIALPPFSMYVWTIAALGRVLNKLFGPTLGAEENNWA